MPPQQPGTSLFLLLCCLMAWPQTCESRTKFQYNPNREMRLNPSLQSLLSDGGLLGHLSYGCVLSRWVLHTMLQEFAYGVENTKNTNNTTTALGGDMIHHVPLCPVIPRCGECPSLNAGLPLILQKNLQVPSGNHGGLQCRFSFPECTPEGQGGPGRLGSAQGHHGD